MKILVQIMDDNGEVVAKHEADAATPSQWRIQPGQRFVAKMPPQSDNQNTGTYELFGFTFQPHVRVDRPNGWTAPPSIPSNAQQPAPFGGYKPASGFPPFGAKSSQTTWSQSAPTPAVPTQGFSPSLRG